MPFLHGLGTLWWPRAGTAPRVRRWGVSWGVTQGPGPRWPLSARAKQMRTNPSSISKTAWGILLTNYRKQKMRSPPLAFFDKHCLLSTAEYLISVDCCSRVQ